MIFRSNVVRSGSRSICQDRDLIEDFLVIAYANVEFNLSMVNFLFLHQIIVGSITSNMHTLILCLYVLVADNTFLTSKMHTFLKMWPMKIFDGL